MLAQNVRAHDNRAWLAKQHGSGCWQDVELADKSFNRPRAGTDPNFDTACGKPVPIPFGNKTAYELPDPARQYQIAHERAGSLGVCPKFPSGSVRIDYEQAVALGKEGAQNRLALAASDNHGDGAWSIRGQGQ